MYYWREVIYEDLPLDDNTLIGDYPYHISANNDVLGFGYHAKSGLMVTAVGRVRPGVPSVLNAFCTSDYNPGTSPHLWGFPNYEQNTLKESFYGQQRNLGRKHDRYSYYLESIPTQNYYNQFEDFSIISVYHPIVDEQCNRVFILDTGSLYYGSETIYNVQSPSVTVYDLPSNGCTSRQFPVIRRVEIPNHLWNNPVGFVYIAVDQQPKGSCDDVFLYITNCFDNSITVYDYKKGDFWAFSDASMRPINAEAGMVFNNNFNYDFVLGIMNVALGYPGKDGDRNAYYAPGASIGEYAVSTKLLKNKRSPYKYTPEDFTLLGYRGCDSQNYRQFFDLSTGVMFFAEMQSNKVRCWNTQLPLNPDNIGVVMESDSLQYVSEIFVDFNGYLWFHSCQLPITFLSDTPLDTTDINSRTFRVKVSDAIRGTVCDTFGHFRRYWFY